MLRLVKSWIGEISANSSLRPTLRNQSKESRWTLIRFGIGATSAIRANECRVAPSARARETGRASASAIKLFHTSVFAALGKVLRFGVELCDITEGLPQGAPRV